MADSDRDIAPYTIMDTVEIDGEFQIERRKNPDRRKKQISRNKNYDRRQSGDRRRNKTKIDINV